MPWGRLNDALNDDAKLSAVSDSAFRLWVCGLVYCTKNLTDGFVPESEIQFFRLKAKNRAPLIAELCTPQTSLGKGPLWHRVEGGYQMHDYHDWNDSRDEVLRQRAKAKERMDRHRGKRTFPRVVNGAMNTICNAVADALRTTNDSANETDHEQVSTYHVPRYVQKQEREDASAPERDTERIQRLNERIRQHRRRRSHETDDGRPRLSVIAALARTVLQTHPDETDDGELRELLKAACARVNLQHDGRSVGDALEQAKAQLRRTS
jgi:hypothetical protein